MTRLGLLVFLCAGALAQTAGMRSVYILPMSGGLDQYLAKQIAQEHVMQVVADPKMADALMTDRLNEAFAQTLGKLHPQDNDADEDATLHHGFQSSGSKGTLFLVDTKSRQVIWSDYEKPARNNSSGQLNREAERIVRRLRITLGK